MNLSPSKPNAPAPCPKGSKTFQPDGKGNLWVQWNVSGPAWSKTLDQIKRLPSKDRRFLSDLKCWEAKDTADIRQLLLGHGFQLVGGDRTPGPIGMPSAPMKREIAPWIPPWKDVEVPEFRNQKGQPLRKYQREGLQMLKHRGGRGGLFLDPGLGKTATALCWVRMNPETISRVVVIATASTKHQWRRAAREWGVPFTVLPVSGKTPHAIPATGILCLNWEILPPDEPTTPKHVWAVWNGHSEIVIHGIQEPVKPGKNKIPVKEWEALRSNPIALKMIYTLDEQEQHPYMWSMHGIRLVEQKPVPRKLLPGWLQAAIDWDPQTIIADEFHLHVGDPDSQRSRALSKLVAGRGFVPMSGSPMRTHVRQLFPVLNLLAPKVFPNKWVFYTRYCEGDSTYGKNWDGAHHLEELHEKIRELGIRYTKEEVLPDLPDRIFNPVLLDCEISQSYKDAQAQFLKLQGNNIFEMEKKMEALSASAFNEKKQAVLEWISDFLESDRKLLLLCWHVVVADFLEAALGKQCVRLREKDREETIRRFVEDPKCRVFLGNIQAAGTGVDGLQAVCSDVAFVELCGSPSDMDQGSSRLHRLGQQGCVTVHFLLAPGTVDMAHLATLGGRDQNMSTVIDGQDEDGEMDSLVSMLKKLDIAPQKGQS